MFHTKDTVIRPDWGLVGYIMLVLFMILFFLGLYVADTPKETEECSPCLANLDDMMFLVGKLRECEGLYPQSI